MARCAKRKLSLGDYTYRAPSILSKDTKESEELLSLPSIDLCHSICSDSGGWNTLLTDFRFKELYSTESSPDNGLISGDLNVENLRGLHKQSGNMVFLKRYNFERSILHNQNDGVPYHCLREASLLQDLKHENIIKLFDVFNYHDQIFLIFDFMDQSLRGYLDSRKEREMSLINVLHKGTGNSEMVEAEIAENDARIRKFLRHILSGLSFCHSRCILHRDLKPQDIRINSKEILKISNFKLARSFTMPIGTYTHEVVTLWYRAPEKIMGGRQYKYSSSLDVWSAGCIFGEMVTGSALFTGEVEIHQLFCIFRKLGTPTEVSWPGVSLLPYYQPCFPSWNRVDIQKDIRCQTHSFDKHGLDLFSKLLTYKPEDRINCKDALDHPYFEEYSGKNWQRRKQRKILQIPKSPLRA